MKNADDHQYRSLVFQQIAYSLLMSEKSQIGMPEISLNCAWAHWLMALEQEGTH